MLTLYLAMIDEPSDKEKFEKIYYAFHKEILHVTIKLTGSREGGEDAAQEAFIRIAKNISEIKMDNRDSVQAYVLTIARNEAIRYMEKEPGLLLYSSTENAIDDTSPDPFEHIENLENKELLVKALLELPISYREILLMRYDQDMNASKIAKHLGTKPAAIRKRLERARKMLIRTYSELEKEELNV